jgi:hypothetical protein
MQLTYSKVCHTIEYVNNMRDKLIALLKQLSLHKDIHEITAEALAQAAHLPLETVLQTLGSAKTILLYLPLSSLILPVSVFCVPQ